LDVLDVKFEKCIGCINVLSPPFSPFPFSHPLSTLVSL
jgi:hypothetical protein